MNILVTGNLGYIGYVMVPYLVSKGHSVTGLDAGYYIDNMLAPVAQPVQRQITKDTRDVERLDFEGIDAVIHLAALSNDPIGELNKKLTYDINLSATLRVAECAKAAGVKNFLFASSPSMFGISTIDGEIDEDGQKHPLTAYAETKLMAEEQLADINGGDFVCTYLRPATAYGASPNQRCDVVFNNFVGCAYTTGKIEIMSDGTPWRPLAHVEDISRAFAAALDAPRDIIENRAFNVGAPDCNFTVRQLAEAAQKAVPGAELTFTGEHADSRSYRVSFKRILSELSNYEPKWDLESAGKELTKLFDKVGFTHQDFIGERCIRIKKLKALMESGRLSDSLRWG